MKARFEFKWQDMWIGVFPRKRVCMDYATSTVTRYRTHFDVWICFVPCFPLHISWSRPTNWKKDKY